MMTNAELAILSLIAEGPHHGYQIEQVIEARGMREWTEVGFSSIYYLLKKLEQQGWISGQIQAAAGRGPARKVYQLTLEGEQVWRQAVLEALSEPAHMYPAIQLGLANLPALAPDVALQALRTYLDNLRQRRAHVAQQAERQQPLAQHVQLMFSYSLAMIDAELGWVQALIEQMEKDA